jgi:beta-glucosidase
LKGEWSFDGFVISDFVFGVRDTVAGVNGGLDVEIPNRNHFAPRKVKKAIKAGKIVEKTIGEAAVRIVRTLIAFADAKDPQDYPASLSGSEEHQAFAQGVAEKSASSSKTIIMFSLLMKSKFGIPKNINCDLNE